MLGSFLRALHSEVSRDDAQELPSSFYQGLLNLVAGVCVSHLEAPRSRGMRARAKDFRTLIDSTLTNPELKQGDIARHFKVSERYVRAVLRAEGISFSNYVLSRRLDLSKELLRDPNWRSETITGISFRAGFSNASHFGRVFRRKFGLSPREFRRASGPREEKRR
jgi:AraC-like DNA-binding protein